MKPPAVPTAARLARIVWPHRNPLARGTDRLEGVTLTIAVVVSLLLVPVALVLGSVVHADLTAKGELQARTAHETVAVLTADAPRSTFDGHGVAIAGKSKVAARWTAPDGSVHTGRVQANDGLKTGAKVRIWVGRHGDLVDRPVSAADADAAGAFAALGAWTTVVCLLALLQTCLHLALNRRRYRAWDEQWERVEPGWNNYRH
jgi:hypothetical protein